MNDSLTLAPDLHAAADLKIDPEERITLCETLDRVLNKGVVVAGELIISVAGIDLIYLNLQVLLASVETAYRRGPAPEATCYGGAA
ncbi:MAG: gas vesicle protein [Isosphaeraceae bacterium]